MCLRGHADSCSPGSVPSSKSLDDTAGHLPGSICLMLVSGSEPVSCSHEFLLKTYISLLFPLPLLATLPFSLCRVSFSSQCIIPGLPDLQPHPWSTPTPDHCGSDYQSQSSTSPPGHCWGGLSLHCHLQHCWGFPIAS